MEEALYYASITRMGALIREQKISPVTIVEECLRRIEALNPSLNAFITVLAEQACAQARVAEEAIKAGKWRGPLHGIPVGIKDFYDTAGVRTTAAFKYFEDRVPANDAESVARLKDAGAIVIGKTNMHQLGMGTTGLESHAGPVRNPWNTGYIAGGSSSGSVVAVATGMCYATLDTDAIGSCRLPAACCGVVGFKGTYNLVSLRGILEGEAPPDEMIRWLAHAGITTRYLEDTAVVLDVLAAPATGFSGELTTGGQFRIGVANNVRADREVMNGFNDAVETIRGLGHDLRSAAVPFGDLSEGVGQIEADRKTIAARVFGDIDLLILPTTTTTVPAIEAARADAQALSPENTVFANYYGLPALSMPCAIDVNGLPTGLQIVGKPGDDRRVLQLAWQYQLASKHNRRHPVA